MQNIRPFPPWVLHQMPGNLSGRTDGRTCRKMVTVDRMDWRTHVQVERGYFRLRTDLCSYTQPKDVPDSHISNDSCLHNLMRKYPFCLVHFDKNSSSPIFTSSWSYVTVIHPVTLNMQRWPCNEDHGTKAFSSTIATCGNQHFERRN